ncbi:unnamed protein product [Phyllotreta striolata]|uniref:MADF domain-containing protein n=1 Tax=Phyllotreta striolata TaxID=444603 RepID=A0A9N9XPL6_PHYSR|nr:unnamed protein product [Phyllotreta striolata]
MCETITAMDYDIKLINVVKRYPELYDGSHRNFKNKEVKAACWKDVAFKMRKQSDEYSVKVVRMRWKSLRDSYVKEIKYKMAVSTGHAVKPRKNWRYSNCMTFLAPFLAISFPLPPDRTARQDDSPRLSKDDSSQDYQRDDEPDGGHFLGALLDFSKQDFSKQDLSKQDFAKQDLSKQDLSKQDEGESKGSDGQREIEEASPGRSRQESVSSCGGEDSDIDSFFKGISEAVKKMNVVNQVFIQRNIVNMILDFKLREAQEKYIIQQREADDND